MSIYRVTLLGLIARVASPAYRCWRCEVAFVECEDSLGSEPVCKHDERCVGRAEAEICILRGFAECPGYITRIESR